jgi:sec-independent protein translocase protein TatC
MSFNDYHDSEDMFADTRMTFGEHLSDLQKHLWRAVYGFLVALVFSFFIGWYVLDFIKAPVQSQLREFYNNRAAKVLKNREHNGDLRELNRPQFVKMSFLPGQLQAAQKGQAVPEVPPPLVQDGGRMTYQQLLERAQLDTAIAADALNGNQWDTLRQAADDLEQIASRLGQATAIPAEAQEGFADATTQLASQSAALVEAARREKPEKATQALETLQDGLAGKGLARLWVRIDDPVRFFALFHGAMMEVGRRPDLSTLSVQEAFMAYVKVSLATALVLGSPWIFWQIWLFVAAGLYPHEKRLVNVYLPASLVLFIAGVLLCQFVVIPKAIGALLWFNEWLNMEPELRFNEWLGFAILMPLVFGLAFQLPLVMMFLERIGIFTVQNYIAKWRIALFLIHVFAAIMVPSPDVVSMEGLALPMFGLYALGILLCKFNPQPTEEDVDVPDSGAMVEV